MVRRIIEIDRDKCNGCGACADVCPQKLVHMVPDDASNFVPCSNQDEEDVALRLCGHSCIGCGDCAEACPEEAISIVTTAPSSTMRSVWAAWPAPSPAARRSSRIPTMI